MSRNSKEKNHPCPEIGPELSQPSDSNPKLRKRRSKQLDDEGDPEFKPYRYLSPKVSDVSPKGSTLRPYNLRAADEKLVIPKASGILLKSSTLRSGNLQDVNGKLITPKRASDISPTSLTLRSHNKRAANEKLITTKHPKDLASPVVKNIILKKKKSVKHSASNGKNSVAVKADPPGLSASASSETPQSEIINDRKSEENSMTCDDCGLTFSKPWLFKQHMKGHVTGISESLFYVCGFCGIRYDLETHLRMHVQSFHPINAEQPEQEPEESPHRSRNDLIYSAPEWQFASLKDEESAGVRKENSFPKDLRISLERITPDTAYVNGRGHFKMFRSCCGEYVYCRIVAHEGGSKTLCADENLNQNAVKDIEKPVQTSNTGCQEDELTGDIEMLVTISDDDSISVEDSSAESFAMDFTAEDDEQNCQTEDLKTKNDVQQIIDDLSVGDDDAVKNCAGSSESSVSSHRNNKVTENLNDKNDVQPNDDNAVESYVGSVNSSRNDGETENRKNKNHVRQNVDDLSVDGNATKSYTSNSVTCSSVNSSRNEEAMENLINRNDVQQNIDDPSVDDDDDDDDDAVEDDAESFEMDLIAEDENRNCQTDDLRNKNDVQQNIDDLSVDDNATKSCTSNSVTCSSVNSSQNEAATKNLKNRNDVQQNIDDISVDDNVVKNSASTSESSVNSRQNNKETENLTNKNNIQLNVNDISAVDNTVKSYANGSVSCVNSNRNNEETENLTNKNDVQQNIDDISDDENIVRSCVSSSVNSNQNNEEIVSNQNDNSAGIDNTTVSQRSTGSCDGDLALTSRNHFVQPNHNFLQYFIVANGLNPQLATMPATFNSDIILVPIKREFDDFANYQAPPGRPSDGVGQVQFCAQGPVEMPDSKPVAVPTRVPVQNPESGYFSCGICGSKYKRSYTLEIHMGKHLPEKTTAYGKDVPENGQNLPMNLGAQNLQTCNKCGITYFEPSLLTEHQLTDCLLKLQEEKDTNVEFRCKKCGLLYVDPNALSRHYLLHEVAENFQSKQSPNPSTAKQDEQQSQGQDGGESHELMDGKINGDPGIDRDSGSGTQSEQNVLQDETEASESKTDPVQYMCDFCPSAWNSPVLLIKHMKFVHRFKDREKYVCDICGFRYTRAKSFERHKLMHAAANSFVPSGQNSAAESRSVARVDSEVAEAVGGGESMPQSAAMDSCNNGISQVMPTSVPRKHSNNSFDRTFQNTDNVPQNGSAHSQDEVLPWDNCRKCGFSFSDPDQVDPHLKTHDSDGPEECSTCGNTFPSLLDLKNHQYSVHIGTKLFTCDICGKSLATKSSLQIHRFRHSGERPYKCNVCSKAFSTMAYLRQHEMYHQKIYCFSCDICGKGFTANNSLRKHMYIHTGEKPYKSTDTKLFTCDICGKSLATKSSLQIHRFRHSGERPYKCNVCSKAFSTMAYLKQHEMFHQKIYSFPCSICGKSFTARNSLRGHMYIHTGEKPYKCTVCPAAFRNSGNLRYHMETHSEKAAHSKTVECKICHKMYATRNSLRLHLLVHQNLKPHVCTICQKPFRLLGALRNHEKRHSDERPFPCCGCDKAFKFRLALKEHLLIHSQPGTKHVCRLPEGRCIFAELCKIKAIKAYICTSCGKGFSNQSKLRVHAIVHTGEKASLCTICGQRFRSRDTLKKHMYIHIGIMPHTCEFCGKKFRQVGNLNVHRTMHTGERPYQCKVCLRSFRIRYRLKLHMRTHRNSELIKAPEYRIQRRLPYKESKKTNKSSNKSSKQNSKRNNGTKNKRKKVDKDRDSSTSCEETEFSSDDLVESDVDENGSSDDSEVSDLNISAHEQPGEPVHEEIVG